MYGMGFSLKPPAWLRNIVIPLPGGGVIKTGPGTSPTPAPPSETKPEPPNSELPGWVIPAAIGAAALLVVPMLMRRRS